MRRRLTDEQIDRILIEQYTSSYEAILLELDAVRLSESSRRRSAGAAGMPRCSRRPGGERSLGPRTVAELRDELRWVSWQNRDKPAAVRLRKIHEEYVYHAAGHAERHDFMIIAGVVAFVGGLELGPRSPRWHPRTSQCVAPAIPTPPRASAVGVTLQAPWATPKAGVAADQTTQNAQVLAKADAGGTKRTAYVNHNPRATRDEIRIGELLHETAQDGRLPGVKAVEGLRRSGACRAATTVHRRPGEQDSRRAVPAANREHRPPRPRPEDRR